MPGAPAAAKGAVASGATGAAAAAAAVGAARSLKGESAGEYANVEACEAVGDGAADPGSDLTRAPCSARRAV